MANKDLYTVARVTLQRGSLSQAPDRSKAMMAMDGPRFSIVSLSGFGVPADWL